MSGRRGHILLWIFAIALMVRVPYVLTRGEDLAFDDSKDYESIAQNMIDGKGFIEESGRQASRAPGYPLFLAGCLKLGLNHRGIYVLQALADACTCILIAILGCRLGGNVVGWLAGIGSAIYPFFIYFSGVLLAETLFMLALVAAILLIETAWRRLGASFGKGVMVAACAGVVIGVGIHLRSSFLLFPVFVFPFWLLLVRPFGKGVAAWCAMMAAMAIVLSPWIARNYSLFHRVIPTTLQVGESLYEANSPEADGGPAMDRIDWVGIRGGNMNELENNDFFRAKAIEYIKSHPGRFIVLAIEKACRFWNPIMNYGPYRTSFYSIISLLATVPVYVFCIIGLWLWRKRYAALALLLSPVLYYAAMHMVFVGSVRYRIPIMPFLILLAAAGLIGLMGRKATESGEQNAR